MNAFNRDYIEQRQRLLNRKPIRWALIALMLGSLAVFMPNSLPLFATPTTYDGLFSRIWASLENAATTSVAWGDYDNDGDLDLAVGNSGQPNRLYRNDDGTLTTSAVWSAAASDNTTSIAWGDYDNDGDLDLAVGNNGQPSRLYRNDGGILTTSAVWSSGASDPTTSIAWGDYDGDGDQDLMVGNNGQPARLYRNNGGDLMANAVWSSTESDPTTSIAWGDYDGDGDLDLAVGNNSQANRLYRNDGGSLAASAVWSSTETDNTSSVAWGDFDGDGDLDLAVGNNGQANRLYRNDNEALSTSADWSSSESDNTTSVAWGDCEGDGDLDLLVGNDGQPSRIYLNDNHILGTWAAWSSIDYDHTASVTWGDYDGNGHLDFAIGNMGGSFDQPNRLYRNESAGLGTNPVWSSAENDNVWAVAWGDYDGDIDLDAVVGGYQQPIRLYRNDNGALTASAVWSSAESFHTTSLAWGDYDGDGDLDVAVGNTAYIDAGCSCWVNEPNRLYRNDDGSLTASTIWPIDIWNLTSSLAWGDYDGDDDLDLVVGGPPRLYRNDNGTLEMNGAWSSADSIPTIGLAWGDYDNDGDLDLVSVNTSAYDEPKARLYRNDDGLLMPDAAWWSSADATPASGVAWGDYDGDGDLDLAVSGQPTHLYRNDNGTLTLSTFLSSPGTNYATNSAWVDYDGDGDLDLSVGIEIFKNDHGTIAGSVVWPSVEIGNYMGTWGDYDGDGDLDLLMGGTPSRLYRNNRDALSLPGAIPVVRINKPVSDANLYSSAKILTGPIIPITYTLSGPSGARVQKIRAFYSMDGGGQWFPAVAASGTLTSNLAINASYTYNWDFLATAQGRSDNAVFRIEAVPAISNTVNAVPGPYLYGRYASATSSFRVRGTQVRVLSDTVPASNAIVYRLPVSQTLNAKPFSDLAGRPFYTDLQGYLQGYGKFALGDRLVALLPVTATNSYTVFHTSAVPTLTGLNMYTVTHLGVQTLTVSSANSLVLFNLNVSLEWDARQDKQFLSQLDHDLQRTSEFLYDWSNGQAALGKIHVYFDREQWNETDIRLFASNELRPNAIQGGLVSDIYTDPLTSTLTYAPGQLNIGAVWNRFGEDNGNLGEDWPRTLAHELGHYALFLDDSYLGLDANGRLMPIDTCTGTAMSDPYREDYSEFRHRDTMWTIECGNTLAAMETGRADWDTVMAMYPWLTATVNSGPSGLPIAVTQIDFIEPLTPSTVLAVPLFNLTQNGARIQPGMSTRAFLYKTDRAIDLGSPSLDQVNARGAQVGDRLCVYELAAQRLGCEVITVGDEELALISHSAWQPDIIVSSVNSRTINLGVNVTGLPPTFTMQARLYPNDGTASHTITPMRSAAAPASQSAQPRLPNAYSHSAFLPLIVSPPATIPGYAYVGTFTLDEPAPQGYVQVWVNEAEPRRETVVDYSLGGSPAYRHGRGAYRHGRGAYRHGRGAPTQSPDGQVLIFGDGLIFEEGEFFALQTVSTLPTSLPGHTPIGKAYRLLKSTGAPSLVGTSINFIYSGRDVPPGEESFLNVYFWSGNSWQKITTVVNTDYNTAIATVPSTAGGVGIYALMSSIEIPLYGPGWNLIQYPAQGTKSVAEALASISGSYSVVYGTVLTDAVDPWKIYAFGVPTWVNDLASLSFAQSYWISVTRSISLQVTGGGASAPIGAAGLPSPPMTVYGTAPISGTVAAWINGIQCGLGQTRAINNQLVYTLNIQPDAPSGKVGCGAAGRSVTFKIGSQPMSTSVGWDIDQVRILPLTP